jgi:hypothetical protein
MAEPLRSDRVEQLSNSVRATPAFVSHREELSCLQNIVQEMRSGSLRHPLRVGYDRGYGDFFRVSLPFARSIQAVLNPSSRESEQALGFHSYGRSYRQPGKPAAPIFLRYDLFACLARRPFLITAGKFNGWDGTPP